MVAPEAKAWYKAGLRKPRGLPPLLRMLSLIKAKIPAVRGALAEVLYIGGGNIKLVVMDSEK